MEASRAYFLEIILLKYPVANFVESLWGQTPVKG